MTDQELDRLMRRVLADAIALDEETYHDAIPFDPSFRHRRQIRLMLANPLRWAKEKARPAWKRVLRRAAVILLAASISLAGVMAASPTVRAAVIRWTAEWRETHIIYRYSGSDISGGMPQYEITKLPEGYAEDRDIRIEWESTVCIQYKSSSNPEASPISLQYNYMQQGSASQIVLDDAEVLSVTVNGQEGWLLLAKDSSTTKSVITWVDTDSNIQFFVQGALEETDLLHIAESVCLVNPTK